MDWTVFGLRTLDTILNLSYFVFILHLRSQCPHHLEAIQSICYANWLIVLWMIGTLWSKCIVLTLDMFYLFFYLFICFMLYFFCLLILLILWFVVADVVVVHSFFDSICCSCSAFSMYFIFLSVISTLPLCIRTL